MSKDIRMSEAKSCTRTNEDRVDVIGSCTETNTLHKAGMSHWPTDTALKAQQQVRSTGPRSPWDQPERPALSELEGAERGRAALRAVSQPCGLQGPRNSGPAREIQTTGAPGGFRHLPLWPASKWVDLSPPRAACDTREVRGMSQRR